MAFKKALSYSLLLLMLLASAVKAGVTVTFLHHDNLDSPVAATDENGDILWRETYAPFGEKAVKPSAASEERVGYTGKLHDNNTGLSYFNARYYDPVVGRFMAMDPVDYLGGGQQYFNRYSYAANNPYRYTDPSGQVLKAVKAVANIIGKAIKNGGNFGKATKDEAIDIFENVVELADGDWTADDAFAVVDLATGFGKELKQITKYDRQKHYGGSQTNSPAAKEARAQGEGKPCPTCGETQVSGTSTAPSPQHEPMLVEHYYEHGGHAMTDAERRAYARTEGINGTQCKSCQLKEGAEASRYSRKKAQELGL